MKDKWNSSFCMRKYGESIRERVKEALVDTLAKAKAVVQTATLLKLPIRHHGYCFRCSQNILVDAVCVLTEFPCPECGYAVKLEPVKN